MGIRKSTFQIQKLSPNLDLTHLGLNAFHALNAFPLLEEWKAASSAWFSGILDGLPPTCICYLGHHRASSFPPTPVTWPLAHQAHSHLRAAAFPFYPNPFRWSLSQAGFLLIIPFFQIPLSSLEGFLPEWKDDIPNDSLKFFLLSTASEEDKVTTLTLSQLC